MPGWHGKTKQAVAEGQLVVAGIAPEQHGDRMALFLQWKGMSEMSVMLDSYNVLGLKVVPITLLIDEAGIIRGRNPSAQELAQFLQEPAAEVGSAPPAPRLTSGDPIAARSSGAPDRHVLLALDEILEDANTESAAEALAHFQLGVAYRKRYDSDKAIPSDFNEAVRNWQAALTIDPSNYIWRRRLQQYGPRLDKPYPFYNWISQAREEITARGDTPHPLVAEPSGAELATPTKGVPPGPPAPRPPHPDPNNKLPHDTDGLFEHNIVTVTHTGKTPSAMRIFVESSLTQDGAKWNDEAGLSTVRITPPTNWIAEPTVVSFLPRKGASLEAPRVIEFELRRSKPIDPFEDKPPFDTSFQFFLHVCHGRTAVCEYLRSNLTIDLETLIGN